MENKEFNEDKSNDAFFVKRYRETFDIEIEYFFNVFVAGHFGKKDLV